MIPYREFIKRVLTEAALKGSSAEEIRRAMREAARAWQVYREAERRAAPSIDEIARRILGK